MKAQPSNQELMDAIIGVVKCEFVSFRSEIKGMIVDGVGEALEQMVFPRFVEMEDRFETIDKRFDTMDKRFDAMDNRFDAMDSRFERVEARLAETVTIDQLDRRLLSLKDELKDTGARAIRKLTHLAQILHANNVLSAAQVVEVGRA